ncbi:SPARC-related modular calcium-binding protein [Sarotherodon galilaeus]
MTITQFNLAVVVFSFIMTGHLLFAILMTLLPPTLTVSTAVISETDSVTLRCQAPASASVYQCYFYTGEQQGNKGVSCLQTLTGTELLLMSHQSSPAEVKVRCFYTVEDGSVNSPSAHSNSSSITIQSQKPEMSVQHFDGEFVLITCSLPGSVKDDTRCNLYFGEASRSVRNLAVSKESSIKTKQRFCQFYVAVADFLRHLHFVQQKDASCDYSLENEPNSLSPRSDRYSLKDIVEKEPPVTVMKSSFSATADIMERELTMIDTKPSSTLTVVDHTFEKPVNKTNTGESSPSTPSASTFTTSGTSPSGTWTLTVVLVVVGFGVTVGVILLVLMILRSKRRNDRYSPKRFKAKTTDDFVCMTNTDHGGMPLVSNDGAYSVITSVAAVRCTTGVEKLNREEFKHDESDVYHVYATISEERATPVPQDMTYSMLQAH